MESTVKVSEESKDLIEILKVFNKAYNMFFEYGEKYYGRENKGYAEESDHFCSKWCDVTNVVEKFLANAMIAELRETNFTSI